MTNEEAIIELRDLISDDRTDKENEALLMAIEAVRNERPKGKCKKCKEYRRFGSRADGYCNMLRMTAKGETFINVNENFFCNYFKEADND